MRSSGRGLAFETLAIVDASRQVVGRLHADTTGPGFTELTAALDRLVGESGLMHGVAVVFCRHTSASLLVGENADPDVRIDLAAALDRLAPRDAGYVHDLEGPDDMPAHIRTALTGSSLAIPILSGRLALGRWQGVFLAEHRDRPHRREVVVTLTGG